MSRTRSDSGLSSGRLGMTSHSLLTSRGGQLATSTPLAGLREGRTPPRAPLPSALQAALQESAKVRRRLADELAREAQASTERGDGDYSGRWPSRRPAPAELTISMASAQASPSPLRHHRRRGRGRSTSPPARQAAKTSAPAPAPAPGAGAVAGASGDTSDDMQSCGEEYSATPARRRHSSDGGVSGVSTISSRSMPEWAPSAGSVSTARRTEVETTAKQAGTEMAGAMADGGRGEGGHKRSGKRQDNVERREDHRRSEKGREDAESRGRGPPHEAVNTRRRTASRPRRSKSDRRPRPEVESTNTGDRMGDQQRERRRDRLDDRQGGRRDDRRDDLRQPSRGGERHIQRRWSSEERTPPPARAGRSESRYPQTPHRAHGDRENPHQGTRTPEDSGDDSHEPPPAVDPQPPRESSPGQGAPLWEPPRRTGISLWDTPAQAGSTGVSTTAAYATPSAIPTFPVSAASAFAAAVRPSPMASSVRYLLEHTTLGRSSAAVTSATADRPTAVTATEEEVPSLERRQLLDAVGGALSCQLEDEAGRLRQLHRQQLQQLRDELQQLERQRQLETEQLQNQVAVCERTLQTASREHRRQLAARDSQLTALREELGHVRQQHQLDRQRTVAECSRTVERELASLRRRHSRQLVTLSQSAAARLADMERQSQLVTQQLLVTVKSLELELERRQERLDEERAKADRLERLLRRRQRATPDRMDPKNDSSAAPAGTSGAGDGPGSTVSIAASASPATVVRPGANPSTPAGRTDLGENSANICGNSSSLGGNSANLGGNSADLKADLAALGADPADSAGLQLRLAAAHQLATQLRSQLQGRTESEAVALAELQSQWQQRLERQRHEHDERTQSFEASHQEQLMALQSSGAEEKVALLQSQMALLSLEASGKSRLAEQTSAELSSLQERHQQTVEELRKRLAEAEISFSRQVEEMSRGLIDQSEASKVDSPTSGGAPSSAVKSAPT